MAEQVNSPAPATSPGHWQTPLTIVLLFLVPLLGVILMWVLTGWSKMVKWIITIIFIILLLATIIVIPLAVRSSITSTTESSGDVDARNNLSQAQTFVQEYGYEKGKYPQTKSYQTTYKIVTLAISDVVMPSGNAGDYHYKYCSTNGSNYKLEVENLGREPMHYILGTDSCTPGL